MLLALALAAVQQQPAVYSTPPSGDTAGYWQQRVRYTITATLDEGPGVVRAVGTLVYVNNSPDTLREFYMHQYLNAFRPGSKWSAVDEREGRERFQRLADPDYGYERFTATPTFNDVPVRPEYPGAPDSTVVRFALPRALAPGDSVAVGLAWDARPSTVPRRQARRGRDFDLAQWYPKVAVYDRGGWEHNAFVPAGELYGEFGTYDVTLALREDQVVGATGVPVAGDPGWERVRRGGVARLARRAYNGVPRGPRVATAPGYKAVRFFARDVHHFGWSTSPDYRYEGAVHVRPAGPSAGPLPFTPWDTVSVHVLYRPGDEAEWGGGTVANRTLTALRWLERIYGPYAYPQMTTLHRIETGGTEFPMLMMNGSPSQGLVLHEGGHIYSYGILANNEWRSGWMDEGLTSYQSAWAQRLTPQDTGGAGRPPAPRARGYAGLALRPTAAEAREIELTRLDLLGRAEPIGRRADAFREFRIYNSMIYARAEQMYGALRDAVGDSAFTAFLHDYYGRWALKHVDELAMRRSAERAAGRDLGWFFDQWVHRTGLVDYALLGARTDREGKGFVTRARVERRGEYRHPMPVGVRTAAGWAVRRGDALLDVQTVEVRTDARPLEARLDPFGTTTDWYAPNDVAGAGAFDARVARVVPGWPLLAQEVEGRRVIAVTPLAWTGTPGGPTGAVRLQSSYERTINRLDLGLALSARAPDGSPQVTRAQGWLAVENPRLFGAERPSTGLRGGVWLLDGMARLEAGKGWDQSRFFYAPGARVTLSLGALALVPYDRRWPDPSRWSRGRDYELRGGYERRVDEGSPTLVRAEVGAGYATAGRELEDPPAAERRLRTGYGRVTAEGRRLFTRGGGEQVTMLRAYAGATVNAPRERLVYASSLDPVQTFENHFFRPLQGVLSGPDARYVSVGNGGLRAYDFRVAARSLASVNVEHAVRLRRFGPAARPFDVYLDVFADAGVLQDAPRGTPDEKGAVALADAGLGLAARGALLDRDVRFRLDFPLYAEKPALVVSARRNDDREPVGARVSFSFTDLW
jgi:hypothetical protein